MRRIWFILVTAAMLAACSSCWAEAAYGDVDLIQYGYREAIAEFDPDAAFSVRAYYTISLPEDCQAVPEAIVDVYGGYDTILLVEYGEYTIQPILQSTFVCVGASVGTEPCILPTPFDLLAKTYDPSLFDQISIQRVY